MAADSLWPRAVSRDGHTQLEIRQAAIDGTRPLAVNIANSAQCLLPESNGRPRSGEPATRAATIRWTVARVGPPFPLEWLHNHKYGVT